MWLFLATEVMFFTGLIGSYIVLRAGSSHNAYSNLYPPTTILAGRENTRGIWLKSAGNSHEEVEHILVSKAGLSEEKAKELVELSHHGVALVSGLKPEHAQEILAELKSAGATAEIEELKTHKWPAPYDELTNPLAINLTAGNTFILICSSVTMVLALAAIQDGKKRKGSFYLFLTVVIGSCFLGVQVYEYYQLMVGHHYPPGISATGHFRPSVSLFASCFFTMTGFHGARDGWCDSAIRDLYPVVVLRRVFEHVVRARRVGRTLLALCGPGLDYSIHNRLSYLISRHG